MDLKRIRRSIRDLERAMESGLLDGPAGAKGAEVDEQSVRTRLASVMQDVTETVESLERDARLGRLAVELARLFAASSAPREFSQIALEAICETMKASTAYVLSFDDDGREATIVARKTPEDATEESEVPGFSRSLLNQLIETRTTLLVRDAQEASAASSILSGGIRSVLATPLCIDDLVGGAIYLENTTVASVFGEADKLLLELIARLLAPYLQAGRRLETAIGERERLAATLGGESSYRDFVGHSPAITKVLATIEMLKDSDAPVLVRGESGTGKELVAKAIHYSGRRAAAPLVTVNCAAIPEGLLESELFGHERGAFTGATEKRKGKFELAHGGTLFLDEVGDLRLDLQAKLLRVLQESCFELVGGSNTIRVDVRLIAATNKDLRKLVAEGGYREELYYRLDVVPIEVPPLRERSEDIPLLARHFLSVFQKQTGKAVELDTDVMEALKRYPFPGNVRELQNLVYRLVTLAPDRFVSTDQLPDYVTGELSVSLDKDPFRRFLRSTPETSDELKARRGRMREILAGYERRLEAKFLKAALERAGGNVSEAARLAGMNRTVFHRRLAALEGDGLNDKPD